MGSVKCCRSINELGEFQAKHDNNSANIKREEAVSIMDNELTHYGVLGMKWGVRKADKIGSRKDGFTIKKGATIYRTAVTDSEKKQNRARIRFN